MLENPTEYNYYLGMYRGVKIYVRLDQRIKNCEDFVWLNDLPTESKQSILQLIEHREHSINTMQVWMLDMFNDSYEISLNDYFSMIAAKEMHEKKHSRGLDDRD